MQRGTIQWVKHLTPAYPVPASMFSATVLFLISKLAYDKKIKYISRVSSFDHRPLNFFADANTGNRVAIAEILKTSMYVLCILHDVITYMVPKSGIEITPFDEDYGVKIVFDEDTFENENVQINVKVFCLFRYVELFIIIYASMTRAAERIQRPRGRRKR